MAATVLIHDDAFELLGDGTPVGERRTLDAAALTHLQGLAARYALLEQRPDPAETHAIGRDLHRWIDGDQRLLSRLIESALPPLLLTIHYQTRYPSPVEWALLQAPWELLADERGYLAADPLLQFSPQRRLGPVVDPVPLDDYRLGLAFMAAAPPGVSELDYEAEEAAILDAVGHTNLDLLVDESGEAGALGRRLADAGGLPVLHLSCHGHHAWRDNPKQDPRPVLMLEDGAFGQRPTDAVELLRALRPAMPRLLFLSACLTAAASGHEADRRSALPAAGDSKQPDGGAGPVAGDAPAHSLTSALIKAGLPAILGWDGSVADTAATRFAAVLYQRLADREDLDLAVLHGRFGIQDLVGQLEEALKGHRAARDLVRDGKARVRAELPRARAAARGNPGLLDLLIARLLLNPAVPLADAEAALTEMEQYLTGGDLPASEPVRELLENIAVDTLLGLAGPAGKGLLRAITLFELPVPLAIAKQLAQAIGGAVQHLIDLALVEPGEDPVNRTEEAIRISPLAAGRLAPLDAKERAPIAGIVIRPLFAAWGGETGWRPAAADLQLTRLALECEDDVVAAACGAGTVRALEADSYQTAAELGSALLGLLDGAARPAPHPCSPLPSA